MLAAVAAFSAADVMAQEPATLRPVTSAYTLEAGSCHIADTYLTPLKYAGWSTAFTYERMQAMKFDPDRFIMNLKLDVGFCHTSNPADNANILAAGIAARWGMMFRTPSLGPVRTLVGGSTGVNLGAFYTSRNGNNPVAAKASWTVNLTAMAVCSTTLLGRQVVFRYQPTLPLTGIFFSQDYGELYYEIYLGNRRNLVHGAWPGNYFNLDNLLTADIRLGATALRLGYHADVLSSRINNITTRLITHGFVIGISGEWLSLSPGRRPSAESRIVSALY